MGAKEIRAEIAAVKKEMRALGIRRRSCFNGGLSSEEYSYNARLFQLESDLERLSR